MDRCPARSSTRVPAALAGAALCLAATLFASQAAAKDHGINTPGGRRIYSSAETFGSALDSRSRRFVIEVVGGYAPEGNLGLTVGYLPKRKIGLEFYGGFGVQLNPSVQGTAMARYLFNVRGYRPYIATGYMFQSLYRIGTVNHNWASEAGYSWKLHATYHLTAGIGIRWLAHTNVSSGSPLRQADVDPASLRSELDAMRRWAPLLALRLSRAF